MEQTLEIWEFVDHHPSGAEIWYQLENRDGDLSIHSNDPLFGARRAEFSGERVLVLLHYLIERAGERCHRQTIEDQLWKRAKMGIVETYLTKLRNLLDDDARSNRRDEVLGGRIIQSLKGEAVRFLPNVRHTPKARIQKTALLDAFSSVPPRDHYIERSDLLDPLIESLVASLGSFSMTAIEGMPGVGKTMLAIALCHDSRVRAAFSDGIIWLTIGRESTVVFDQRVEFICRKLNHRFDEYSREAYQTLLQDKAVLVVLDDVWKLDEVNPFRLTSARSRLLFTTRDEGIANSLRILNRTRVGDVDLPMARRLLGYWSGRDADLPEPQTSGIVAQCAGHPLALSLLGASLRDLHDSEWAYAFDNLKKTRLKYVRSELPDYQHETLHAAIAVSVDALQKSDPELKNKYLRLAVLLDDMLATAPVLEALWGGTIDDRRAALKTLTQRSMARRDPEGIRLHSLQHDFLRSEFGDAENLAAIHAALRRSLHIVAFDPTQFASQMTGRLLRLTPCAKVREFLDLLLSNEPRPRLRPLWPTLESGIGPSHKILTGHKGKVTALAISANGKLAVGGSPEGLIVWDLDGNDEPRVFNDHRHGAVSLAITSDGRRIVSAWGNAITVRDLDGDGEPIVLRGHQDGVAGLAVSDDGQRVVSISCEGQIRTWDLAKTLDAHLIVGNSWAALSHDGRWALSAQPLTLCDLDGRHEPIVLKGNPYPISEVSIGPDAKRVVSCYDSVDYRGRGRTHWTGPVTIWRLDESDFPKTEDLDYEYCPSSRIAISALGPIIRGTHGGIHIRDSDGTQSTLRASNVTTVAMSADGTRAVSKSGAAYDTVTVWDLTAIAEPRSTENGRDSILGLAASADCKCAISGSHDGYVVWDLDGNHKTRVFVLPSFSAKALALNADRLRAVSFSWDGAVKVWDLGCDKKPRDLGVHGGPHELGGVAISRDGKWAISCTISAGVVIWGLEGQYEQKQLTEKAASSTAINADGSVAVIGSSQELSVWNLGETPKRHLLVVNQESRTVAISQDGRVAAVGGFRIAPQGSFLGDTFIEVWDLENRTIIRTLPPINVTASGLALNRDATRLVAAFIDGTLIVYCLARGEELCRVTTDHHLTACAWAGECIVAGDITGTVHLFAFDDATASPRHLNMVEGRF